jgi:hypothetical protein
MLSLMEVMLAFIEHYHVPFQQMVLHFLTPNWLAQY